MADFCQQCSIEVFGEDTRDLAGLGDGTPLREGYGWKAICEGCGFTIVDDAGKCINKHCLRNHAV